MKQCQITVTLMETSEPWFFRATVAVNGIEVTSDSVHDSRGAFGLLDDYLLDIDDLPMVEASEGGAPPSTP